MFQMTLSKFQDYPALQDLIETQLRISPSHEKFLTRRFSHCSAEELYELNHLGNQILQLAAEQLDSIAADYAWLCERQLEEELYFRRYKRYRLSSFKEAYEEVYSNHEYMSRYMNGLLLSQLWWSNHAGVLSYYRNNFLKSNPKHYTHLEIGPGHGLFLYYAAQDPNANRVEGWDISPASVEQTQRALAKLKAAKRFNIICQDFFSDDISLDPFESIVFSEMLEHMEQPELALQRLHKLLAPTGRLFINMPINSPAPDHLFNVSTPDELFKFIERNGFNISDFKLLPATNSSLEMAQEKKLTISCAIITTKRN